jgi:hypothetical protein
VSLGGEDLVVYLLDGRGRVQTTIAGNKCASGTGEFFRQQLGRMDLRLEDLDEATDGARALKLSARCSVFMKSDCTHRLNKGEATRGDVALSLSKVMADKVSEFLIGQNSGMAPWCSSAASRRTATSSVPEEAWRRRGSRSRGDVIEALAGTSRAVGRRCTAMVRASAGSDAVRAAGSAESRVTVMRGAARCGPTPEHARRRRGPNDDQGGAGRR